MLDFLHGIHPLAAWVARSSFQATVLVVLILLLRWALGKRLSPGWRSALWLLVLVRLALPAAPRSDLSLFNLLRLEDASAGGESASVAPAQQADVERNRPQGPPELSMREPAPARTGDTGAPGAVPPTQARVPTTPVVVPRVAEVETAPVAAADAPRSIPADWRGWAAVILPAVWLLGATAMLARFSVAAMVTAARLRGLALCRDGRALAVLEECKVVMRVRSPLRVLETSAVATPALAGLWRPRLLLPEGMTNSLPPRELRFVFLHELAHLKRWDLPVNWLGGLLGALHWFNPVLWLAFARLRADRELACDAMVLQRTGHGQAREYGRAIVGLLERISGRDALPGVVRVVEDHKEIRRRIAMIASFRRPSRGWTVLGITLLCVLGVVALTNARAGSDATTQAAEAARPTAAVYRAWVKPLTPPRTHEADAKTHELLGKKLPEAHFEAADLKTVLEWLRQTSGLNVDVRWNSLATAGIEANVPVSLRLKDVTVERVLRAVLEKVDETAQARLTYVVDDGVVVVGPREGLATKTVTKVYDVRPLVMGRHPGDEKDVHWEPLTGELVKTIQEQVAPTSWRGDAGGDTGQINSNFGQLVITQTVDNHRLIESLLARLMESRFPKWQQEIHQKLQKNVPKLDLQGVEFAAALDYLRQVTGLNIVVDPAGSKAAQTSLITLRARDVTAQQALGLVTRMAKMQWELSNGVVYISPTPRGGKPPGGFDVPPVPVRTPPRDELMKQLPSRR